ncbi:splicing factor 3B subunit 1-like [Dorcoceras hygrometricum]|uniref:Splicing factor 3B subunit 1-like n=1 Tax=Dorcoceras hygrometricum TaxID=472368 RepID=A0A2Z7D1K8_9LAMI|nr:splicing factor 3B subunit 1-like [Dorcoceras hygrometricum]
MRKKCSDFRIYVKDNRRSVWEGLTTAVYVRCGSTVQGEHGFFRSGKRSDLRDLSFRGNIISGLIRAESAECASSSPINLSAMASALIINTIQVYFAFVLGMEHEGMVSMFEALLASGLSGFLGCSSALFEAALVEFFHNASIRDGMIVSTVQGKTVAISEELRALSYDDNLLRTSCKKREMASGFRLLNDILAKSVTVKAGSFDAVTHERFLMMSVIYGGVPVNWGRLLFNTLKDMVTPATRKARGYERKRTTTRRATPTATDLVLVTVAQEAVPIQMISAVTPPAPKRKAPKRRLQLPAGFDDEIIEKEPAVESVIEQQRERITADEVDKIIDQIITETAQRETDVEEPSLTRSDDIIVEITKRSIVVNDEDDNLDGAENESARKMAYFTAPKQFLTEPLRSGEDDDMSGSKQPSKIIEPTAAEQDKEIESVATVDLSLEMSVATMTDSEDTEPLSKVLDLTEKSKSDEESMPIKDILKQFPEGMMLPSLTDAEPTRIKFGLVIEISGLSKGDCLSKLAVLDSVKDIIVKEKHILAWAKTDSLETAIRTKTLVDGSWLIQEGNDFLKHLPKPVVSLDLEFPPQRQFDDNLALVSVFFKVIRKRWADVCIEVLQFSASGRLQPVGSHNFCRDIVAVGTVLRASVNQIQTQHVQKRDDAEKLKDVLLLHIRSLEQRFTEILDQLDRTYRGRDDKMGEIGSSRGPQRPLDDHAYLVLVMEEEELEESVGVNPLGNEVVVVRIEGTGDINTRSVLGKRVYLVTLAMSLFDLQDVCIAIGSLATLDLPMVVDLIGIYGLKGPYCTLTTTNWFFHDDGDELSKTLTLQLKKPPPHFSSHLTPPPPCTPRAAAASLARNCSGQYFEENSSAPISSGLLVQVDEGVSLPVVDLIDVIYRRLPSKNKIREASRRAAAMCGGDHHVARALWHARHHHALVARWRISRRALAARLVHGGRTNTLRMAVGVREACRPTHVACCARCARWTQARRASAPHDGAAGGRDPLRRLVARRR